MAAGPRPEERAKMVGRTGLGIVAQASATDGLGQGLTQMRYY